MEWQVTVCQTPQQPILMHSKFLLSVMDLGMISNDSHVICPYFFPIKVNVPTYIEFTGHCCQALEVAQEGLNIYQQDYTLPLTQLVRPMNGCPNIFMIMLLLTFAWPPDLNHMDDYNWVVIEWEINKHTHNTKDSLNAAEWPTEIKNT